MRGDRPPIRAIRGPIILITVGVLFAFQNLTNIGFDQTWPVLLIVFGLLSLVRRSFEPQAPPPAPPPYGYPPPPPGSFSQGTYSQGPYKGPTPPGTQPK